jgi:putative Mg2+ transporter-C (MgtC) family protein
MPVMAFLLQWADPTAKMGLGLLLGAAIGVERQWHQKMAGLRTNALVALGAAGFVTFAGLDGHGEAARIVGQIVSGIGFLGAGVILREGINVHGLNTAATLWCSAMVGSLAGAGQSIAAGIATFFIVITNIALRPLVRRLNARLLRVETAETYYTVEIVCEAPDVMRLREAILQSLQRAHMTMRGIDSDEIMDSTRVRITARAIAETRSDTIIEAAIARVRQIDNAPIISINWAVERAIPES